MFRENDFWYLAGALLAILGLTIVSIGYEGAVVDQDSKLETIVAIIRWQGVILPVTVTGIATAEVVRVIASRMIAHFSQKDRAEGKAEGKAEERKRIVRELRTLPTDLQNQIPLLQEEEQEQEH